MSDITPDSVIIITPPPVKNAPTPHNELAKIFAMQDIIKNNAPAVPMPVQNHFAPHVYVREIFMPAGTLVVGKMHKTEHFNIITQGTVRIIDADDSIHEVSAGDIFTSSPGVKKVLYIVEDTRWITVHPTNTTDMKALEEELIVPEEDIRDSNGNLLVDEASMKRLLGVI
jgi:hypothetical protein